MRPIISFVIFTVSYVSISPMVWSQEDVQQEMRSLDEQVQEVKTDVLTIARDLTLLEERLLYPSNTQLAVFVEMDTEDDVRLDAVSIEIDGEPVAHYIYSFKELEALQNGGVQRVYSGNVSSGSHEIVVAINGKLANGRDFSTNEVFSFSKAVEPKLIGLTIVESFGGASIVLDNW